jgi:hypothetical protein
VRYRGTGARWRESSRAAPVWRGQGKVRAPLQRGTATACPVVAPGRSNVVRVDAVHAAQKGAVRSRPRLDRSAPDVEMAGTDAFRTAAIAGLVATVVDLFVL